LGFSKELSTYRTFGYFTKAIEFAMRIFLYHLVSMPKLFATFKISIHTRFGKETRI
jgi:hypothetical protein